MVNADEVKYVATGLNLTFAAISLASAWFATRRSRVAGQMDALLKVAEWFREDDVVAARKSIYSLSREGYSKWSDDDKNAVDVWVAYVDIVATLVITKNISRTDLIRMYGDVLFRTLYVLAPFVSNNLSTVGLQYLKSTQIALPSLVGDWDRISKPRWWNIRKRKRYPRSLVIHDANAASTPITLTPENFMEDGAIQQIINVGSTK